jgi:hypothetical protein
MNRVNNEVPLYLLIYPQQQVVRYFFRGNIFNAIKPGGIHKPMYHLI